MRQTFSDLLAANRSFSAVFTITNKTVFGLGRRGRGSLVVGNAGSLQGDTDKFGGIIDYNSGLSYIRGTADYYFGHSSETNDFNGSTGSFGTSGYGVNARLGQIFVLFASYGAPPSRALPTKARPDRPAAAWSASI